MRHEIGVDDGISRVITHPKAAEVMRTPDAGESGAHPDFLNTHLLQKIDALGAHILDHRQFVPVLLERYAYHREAQAAAIARDRIKVEEIGFIHQTFGLRLDRKVTVPILDQMLLVAPSPTRHVRGNVSLATEIG